MNPQELQALGFREKEAVLYIEILARGGGSAAELAQRTGLKRPTVYSLLDMLGQKRLVSNGIRGKKRIFEPEAPERIESVLENQRAVCQRLLPQLNALYFGSSTPINIRVYKGLTEIASIYSALLEVKSKEYFYIGSIQTFVSAHGREYANDFVRERIRRKIWANALRIRSQELDDTLLSGEEKNYRRVRYLPQSPIGELATLILFDGKVAIYTGRDAYCAILVENEQYYTTMKLVWDCLWAAASA